MRIMGNLIGEELSGRLAEWLRRAERVAVALSGGADSSVLAAAAVRALGAERCLAITASAPYMIGREIESARSLCRLFGVRHIVLEIGTPAALENNPPLRCYLCKKALFTAMKELAAGEGFPILCDGTHAGDLSDYRPGIRALGEAGVASPWLECRADKAGIAEVGLKLGVPAEYVRAPSSPCLLTRLEHGMKVEEPLLRRIEAAEELLRRAAGSPCRVRCRRDGSVTLETPRESLASLARSAAGEALLESVRKATGLARVSFDPRGYRRGSMNVKPA